ncbi:hypothetical protein [Dyella sp. 2RAB6]|uniref:hypothetical protein n=1 Tax=Dyella sp. 2RAB6 TaxID=3232992 RepID=UPI003F9034AC
MADILATIKQNNFPVLAATGNTMRLAFGTYCLNERYQKLPPRGTGYIAGEAPDGLVTFNGAPAIRVVDVFDRLTNIKVATVVSASDGTYHVGNLDTTRLYDVRARGQDEHENDIIAARVTPHA